MNRTTVLLSVALAIGYGSLIVLGITVLQQRSELASIEARLPASPTFSPAATPSLVSIASPSPSTAPSTAPVPQLQKVTDNYGHIWLYSPTPDFSNPLTVKVGAAFGFTAFAQDPLNRPIEYLYFYGNLPSQTIVCAWGPPTCSWTVPSAQLGQANLFVAIRIKNGTPRIQSGGCFTPDPCDVWFEMPLVVSSS